MSQLYYGIGNNPGACEPISGGVSPLYQPHQKKKEHLETGRSVRKLARIQPTLRLLSYHESARDPRSNDHIAPAFPRLPILPSSLPPHGQRRQGSGAKRQQRPTRRIFPVPSLPPVRPSRSRLIASHGYDNLCPSHLCRAQCFSPSSIIFHSIPIAIHQGTRRRLFDSHGFLSP